MRWDYLGRPGYPGWHLECATIIHKELGEPIDIHTGGIDHIPVHHTNEIAECFAAYGTKLSRYWLHCNFITIDGEKISKSLGNTYMLDDLAKQGFTALDYKMWVLSGHYQSTRNFTFESLAAAKQRRLNWRNKIAEYYQSNLPGDRDAMDGVMAAVENNLNSPEAFSIIDNANLSLEQWGLIDQLFGLKLLEDTPDISANSYALIKEREEARETRDFAKADELRDKLAELNIEVNDTADGPVWRYIK